MTYYLGIDLGGTNTVAGIVSDDGSLTHKRSVKTAKHAPASEIIAGMIAASKMVLEKAGLTLEDITAAGIGSPGIVDQDTGRVVFATNLPFSDSPVAAQVSAGLQDIPVFLVNDANAAALGEFKAGAGRSVNSMVALTLGTGIGSGIILENDDALESRVASAEFGHMIIDQGGRTCGCGNLGCFEMYGSATGLTITTKEFMERNKDSLMWEYAGGSTDSVNGTTSFKAMHAGDRAGAAVVESYLSSLAVGITNIINIIQPELICIGGGVGNEGDGLMIPLRKKVKGMNLSQFKNGETKLERAILGSDAGVIGAALFAAAKHQR